MTFTTPVHTEFTSLIGKRTHVHLHFSHAYVLLASDFHELWHRVMSVSLGRDSQKVLSLRFVLILR